MGSCPPFSWLVLQASYWSVFQTISDRYLNSPNHGKNPEEIGVDPLFVDVKERGSSFCMVKWNRLINVVQCYSNNNNSRRIIKSYPKVMIITLGRVNVRSYPLNCVNNIM